jgi:hypothetical protein
LSHFNIKNKEIIMETVILVVLIIGVLAYYGFMRSVETGAKMANTEVEHLADVHMVALIERTSRLDDKINDKTLEKATSVKAKLKAMREASEA